MSVNFRFDDNRLYFKLNNTELCISVCGDGVFRLQSVGENGADDMGAAQLLAADLGEKTDFSPVLPKYESDGTTLNIYDGAKNRCIVSDKNITLADCDGNIKERVEDVYVNENRAGITLSASPKKKYYGTGERFDSVNQYGKRLDMYAVDKWCRIHNSSYCPIPFVITSDLTGIFMNRFEHQIFDIGKSKKERFNISLAAAPIDLYIIIQPAAAQIISSYCRLTGFAPVPASWQFGTQVCRYAPDFSTPRGIFDMAENMKKHGLPWDAVIVEGWKTYDKARHSELKSVAQKLHKMGKKLLVYEPCGRIKANFEADYGITDDDAVHFKGGASIPETHSHNPVDHYDVKKMKCIDISNPVAMKKWFKLWDYLIDDIGVDGAKIDFCEQLPDGVGIDFYDGRKPNGMHHRFPTVYNSLMYRRFNRKADGGMNFSRGGGIGAQRYPFIWAGDQRREFKFIKAVLYAALSMGLSGVPFLSWDTAGYRNSFNPLDLLCQKNVFMRGVQLSAFSANIQTHGKVKRPYDFDEKTIGVYRKYALIHEKLKPYLLQCAEQSSKTGIPLIRHLFLYDNTDEKCLVTDDEYMLGDCLLVAPVVTRKNRRDIYLPCGEWINVFNGEHYQGKAMLKNYKVKIDEIPVFYLAGSSNKSLEDIGEFII